MKYENDWSNMDRKSLVAAANQIVLMDDEIHSLRSEVERLRGIQKEYYKFLNDSIKHNDVMMRNLLITCLENASKS